MRWISWLFRWTRRSKTRWFFEAFRGGSMKVRIGQKLSSSRDLEVMLQLETRGDFGKWVPFATFRHADVPTVRMLLLEVDRHMKSLLTRE